MKKDKALAIRRRFIEIKPRGILPTLCRLATALGAEGHTMAIVAEFKNLPQIQMIGERSSTGMLDATAPAAYSTDYCARWSQGSSN